MLPKTFMMWAFVPSVPLPSKMPAMVRFAFSTTWTHVRACNNTCVRGTRRRSAK
jgi:hypothetical protein